MRLFNFIKKRPTSTTSSRTDAVPSAPDPGVSVIEREHFILQVPFQWVAVASDNPLEFEFHNKTLQEQLIVSVLVANTSIDVSKQRSVAEELANVRLSALDKISNGEAVTSPLQFQAGSEQVEVRSTGHDQSHGVRFAFVVRVTKSKVVTVALTRYFLEEVGTPFDAYAGVIFDLLQVRNA